VGAGLLGFAINPPASLYFVQGLNMTPAHGHAALFGVYGMLGIGLMLFCLRGLYDQSLHADRWLAPSFWGLNVGLAMMVFLSLLPAGIYQAWASVSHGLWYARSPEIIHSPVMEALVWLRVPGDLVFAKVDRNGDVVDRFGVHVVIREPEPKRDVVTRYPLYDFFAIGLTPGLLCLWQ
jgi:nitric oxide reductase subunit B